ESDEQPERLVVDAIFRIIQENAGGFRCHPLAARRVMREQISQVAAPHCLVMIFEGPPCQAFVPRSRARCFGSCGHSAASSRQLFRASPGGRARLSTGPKSATKGIIVVACARTGR